MAVAGKGTVELLKNAIVVNASVKHTATVIFLHGLGDTGDGWAFMWNQLKQPYVKLICPTASTMPVSVNGGYRMPSWFDIYSLGKEGRADIEGMKVAAKKVHELLDFELETTGVPSERVILGGFSQGGSLGMLAALTYTKPLAGILAMSSWLRNVEKEEKIEDKITVNKTIPFLQLHGEADPMVPFELGKLTSEFVKTFNSTNYEFKSYPGLPHSSSPEEMDYAQKWMNKILLPTGGNI